MARAGGMEDHRGRDLAYDVVHRTVYELLLPVDLKGRGDDQELVQRADHLSCHVLEVNEPRGLVEAQRISTLGRHRSFAYRES